MFKVGQIVRFKESPVYPQWVGKRFLIKELPWLGNPRYKLLVLEHCPGYKPGEQIELRVENLEAISKKGHLPQWF